MASPRFRTIPLLLSVASALGAQNPTPATRPDTVVSAARAPRVAYVAKRSRADTLRGSFTTPARRWWDVTFYDLHVSVRASDSSVAGWNAITYRVVERASAPAELQIDLMEPLVLDSVVQESRRLPLRHEGNAHFVSLSSAPRVGTSATALVDLHVTAFGGNTPGVYLHATLADNVHGAWSHGT